MSKNSGNKGWDQAVGRAPKDPQNDTTILESGPETLAAGIEFDLRTDIKITGPRKGLKIIGIRDGLKSGDQRIVLAIYRGVVVGIGYDTSLDRAGQKAMDSFNRLFPDLAAKD